ncbi:hypothetical protein JANAI62_12440 [Jannaschia pagri]|uniref:Uncharacterized protein n=1 Tax=Jannaschia pagri TaxID=2829797 RepID=A0ABQ4NJU2_9RHOB|nr:MULTISPECIES: hypothetical protein [unclassified Jannaschia]GIT90789.1 hypothetical protein JANAI61_12470 [Jannaschia sp. AI_61]GIT94621.1 hypothetical protein JANAI62_12440 [Jannaschia sp. AI_62]
MKFDRLLSKAAARLQPASGNPDPVDPLVPPNDGLRGSGSWANEWAGAKSAVERAKSLTNIGRPRKGGAVKADITEGTVRVKPLMTSRDVKLYNWIVDRLEAEAPTCSLHCGVALNAFLTSAEATPEGDPLAGLVADLVITDEQGQPLMALLRENRADPRQQLLTLDALLDADVPIIDIQPRPVLSAMWAEISANLPDD